MATAQIEPVSAWMRIWSDDAAVYGEPFDFFVGIRWLTKTSVEVCGLRTDGDKPFTIAHALAVRRELANYGVKHWTFKRYKNGTEKTVRGRTI